MDFHRIPVVSFLRNRIEKEQSTSPQKTGLSERHEHWQANRFESPSEMRKSRIYCVHFVDYIILPYSINLDCTAHGVYTFLHANARLLCVCVFIHSAFSYFRRGDCSQTIDGWKYQMGRFQFSSHHHHHQRSESEKFREIKLYNTQ